MPNIVVMKRDGYIANRSAGEVIDGIMIRLSDNSIVSINEADIITVADVPVDAKYYKDGVFSTISADIIKQYATRVKELVRQKYKDIDDEIAIIRKHNAGIDSKKEFTTYNTYVEDCKLQAKQELGIL